MRPMLFRYALHPSLVAALISFLAIAAWLSDTALAHRRVSLVIGNSAYEVAGLLRNPRNDAADMAEKLESLGFEVYKGFDLTKGDMDRLIREFSDSLDKAALGLLFYAGHGIQVGGVNSLVPVDAKAKSSAALDFEMIRVALIQSTMERGARANIIILDACRNTPLARTLAGSAGARSLNIGTGLAEVKAGRGTLVSFSTQPGNVALDGDGRNSPYATALLRHIGRKDEDIVNSLIKVRKDVLQATDGRQLPWDQHSLLEQIVLAGGATKSPVPGTDPSSSREAAITRDDMKTWIEEIRRKRRTERKEPAAPAKPTNERGTPRPDAGLAEAWSSIQQSTSEAVLGAFIATAAGTVYADFARARLDEVRAMAAASARQVAPQGDASSSVAGGGNWAPRSACDRLWYQRNAVFHRFKYCFTGEKGRLVFGNVGCSRTQDDAWDAMGDSDRETVNRIKELERANGC